MNPLDPASVAAFISDNAGYVAIILFLLLFAESLVGVGYFLPAATVLLSVGALVGSGVAAPVPAFAGAFAGAILGGEANFRLGRHLSNRLPDTWPFSRYPVLLNRSQAFIERHGGKSILLGRFSKPLRPTIPAVAGMLEMPGGRFRGFNAVAGVLWTLMWMGGGAVMTATSGFNAEQAVTISGALLLVSLVVAVGAISMDRWRRGRLDR